MTCCQLSKRLPNNSTIFAAEATAITLALNYYQLMDPVQRNDVVFSNSMSCLQVIEGEVTENPLICIAIWKLVPALTIQHIMPCMNSTKPLDLYAPRPNGSGGMTWPPAPPVGLKVEEAMTSEEINAELVCPLRTPNSPPGPHDYDPKRHDLIEGVRKCTISRQEAQARFNEYREAQGWHDEIYTDGWKMNERVVPAAVINRHFQNGETTCHQLSKRLPDNKTIFAAEATTISLSLLSGTELFLKLASWNYYEKRYFLLSDMNGQTFYTIHHLNHPKSDGIC